ncbi:hypothetical protein D3C80_1388100 [compost metagenome]
MLVKTSRTTIDIGWVVIVVQYLNFIKSLEENATIPSALSFALDELRTLPFNMELKVAEMLGCLDISSSGFYFKRIIGNCPVCIPLFALPFAQVLAVKKNNGITWDSLVKCYCWRNRFVILCIAGFHICLGMDCAGTA